MSRRSANGRTNPGLIVLGVAVACAASGAFAGTFIPQSVEDASADRPLPAPSPASYEPRYISGFGSNNAFTVFFEDRASGSCLRYADTTSGPTGFPSAATSCVFTDTHFTVKDWPITINGTNYPYRGWASSMTDDSTHNFYVGTTLTDWIRVSSFVISNAPGFWANGYNVHYGFHDVIQINGKYYAWGETGGGHTWVCRSTDGDDHWEVFAAVGGSVAARGSAETGPLIVPESPIPTGSFVDLGHGRGYGKMYARGSGGGVYLAINTAAVATLPPAELEAAFINPTNWTWNNGSTGVCTNATAVLVKTAVRDIRECWVVPQTNPDAPWIIVYNADYASTNGGRALGYATMVPPDADPSLEFIAGAISYAGTQTGTIFVTVSNAVILETQSLAVPGAYSFADLAAQTNYWVEAYRDSNGNDVRDTWEAAGSYAGNPLLLTNDETNANIVLSDPVTDSDGDGLTDYSETYTHFTNPYSRDTDSDGMPDGWEVANSLDPLADDSADDPDTDDLSNLREYELLLNPHNDDTDGDGFEDGDEVLQIESRASDINDPVVVDDDGPSDPLPGDPSASDPSEDGSLAHPFDAIQEGVDAATNTMVVLVLDGTYTNAGNRNIRPGGKAIVIRSRNGRDVTLIEDAQSGFICDSGETSNTVIRGLTIHMEMDSGGWDGILCDGSGPLVRDCRVWGSRYGLSCTNGASPIARECLFDQNAAAGVRVINADLFLDRCRVVSNTAVRGAGLRIDGASSVSMVNCLVEGNQSATEGGGVFLWAGASLTSIHCTFVGNAASNAGGGLSLLGGSSLACRNSIIWGNAAPTDACFHAEGTADFEYSCLESNVPGTGNITNDPAFAAGYELLFGSPAIDAANESFDPGIDLASVGRPLDGNLDGVAVADMGAYEYVHPLADTDSDGLTDTNEIAMGTNPTKMDTDGDHMDDGWEVLAGTDPLNMASYLGLTEIQRSPVTGFAIRWTSVGGRHYRLDCSTNLLTDAFEINVATNIPAVPPMNVYTDGAAVGPGPWLYRIELE